MRVAEENRMRFVTLPGRGDPLRPVLMATTLVVVFLGLAAELAARVWPALPGSAVAALSLSYEGNVPTWFAAVLLFSCAQELVLVARGASANRDRWRFHWWGLAAGFLCISLDEVVGMHELLSIPFDTTGVLYFGWVIPAAALLAVLTLAYARFVIALPGRLRARCVVAGLLYVGGAVAMELPLGAITEAQGSDSLAYALVDAVEETLELVGAGLFLLAVRTVSRPGAAAGDDA
jgi:hypothetical protein